MPTPFSIFKMVGGCGNVAKGFGGGRARPPLLIMPTTSRLPGVLVPCALQPFTHAVGPASPPLHCCPSPSPHFLLISRHLGSLQGREKINLIFTFTKMGYDILVSDVDTVWLRNPIPYVKRVGACGPMRAGGLWCLVGWMEGGVRRRAYMEALDTSGPAGRSARAASIPMLRMQPGCSLQACAMQNGCSWCSHCSCVPRAPPPGASLATCAFSRPLTP